jgi:hypothetical protein
MINQPWNAISAQKFAEEQAEKTKQTKTQLNELHQQTLALSDVKKLTEVNIECAKNIVSLTSENTETLKQIALMTAENQKSSTKQFRASIIVSITALLISIATLIVSCIK